MNISIWFIILLLSIEVLCFHTGMSIEQICMQTECYLLVKGETFPTNHHHRGTRRRRCKCTLLSTVYVTWLSILMFQVSSMSYHLNTLWLSTAELGWLIVGPLKLTKYMELNREFWFGSQCSTRISIHNFLIFCFVTIGKEWKMRSPSIDIVLFSSFEQNWRRN